MIRRKKANQTRETLGDRPARNKSSFRACHLPM
jgi:hypothetical protein